MRHTLIPQQERIKIHREYHLRVIIVMITALAVSMAIGIVALFPAYINAGVAKRNAENVLKSVGTDAGDSDLPKVSAELAIDGKLISALATTTQTARISDVIRSIVAVRSSVRLNSFTIDRQSTSSMQVTIKGVSPTRQSLLSFKSRLEEMVPGAKVDLPIEDLKNSSNLPFSIRMNLIMK